MRSFPYSAENLPEFQWLPLHNYLNQVGEMVAYFARFWDTELFMLILKCERLKRYPDLSELQQQFNRFIFSFRKRTANLSQDNDDQKTQY
ncbi:hypothetical protein C5N92_07455 [Glaesserella australis]|uniref:Uncharacterized protein n=1 Tax=Glaesserella australis TaxID=2094024 RepID=A0A328BXY3_9PAST|nr:hypothetical protein CJD39_01165 [Glaesserella sp. 15-184]RAL18541.1 hypothetical protein C5N92_07455 [Glaesserella australis]